MFRSQINPVARKLVFRRGICTRVRVRVRVRCENGGYSNYVTVTVISSAKKLNEGNNSTSSLSLTRAVNVLANSRDRDFTSHIDKEGP